MADNPFDDFEEPAAAAYSVTMSGVFGGTGDDAETAQLAARDTAQAAIRAGNWQIDDGSLVEQNPFYYEFSATTILEVDSMSAAIALAADQLGDEWELVGDPEPLYLDP